MGKQRGMGIIKVLVVEVTNKCIKHHEEKSVIEGVGDDKKGFGIIEGVRNNKGRGVKVSNEHTKTSEKNQ